VGRAGAEDERGIAGRLGRKEAAMIPTKQAAHEFLAQERIAVTGVSRSPNDHGANVVYKRLRDRGYIVFPINPNADEVEGARAYHDLKSVPEPIDGVVIGTSPEHGEDTMRECVELGIRRVWMHRGPGPGSVSEEATKYGREHGVTVIDGGCPCMFAPTADVGHKVMHLLGVGHMPKQV
jgi:predicted CoA-binding protein